jgi:ABC-type dipeptide/oligopeptide/nickel transport system permease component
VRNSEYVVRRIAFAPATIFVAMTLNFVIFRAAPGDATTALRCLSCTDQVRAQVRQKLGLDKSKFQQYVIYLKDIAHGDFGRSFQNRQPVLRNSGSRSRTRCRCSCSARTSRSCSG